MSALKQLKIGLAALGLLLVIGTFGYHYIQGWSYLDSFYFTVITLATVGYQEVTPLTPEGKMFTISLIIVGVTLAFWVVASLIEVTIGEQLWQGEEWKNGFRS